MSDSVPRVAVVGGGIFGCAAALALADSGFDVVLIERKEDILLGATKNNLNRVHYGYHYPRDLVTALQSKNAFNTFVDTFPECIVSGFPNYYLIADDDSRTSPERYIEFCKQAGLECERVSPSEIPLQVRKCSLAVKAKEAVYDHDLIRDRLKSDFRKRKNIQAIFNVEVREIDRRDGGYRLILTSGETIDSNAVVNCSYTNINKLDGMLDLPITKNQYEYTVVPIIETDFDPIGLAIMDGPFTSIMPYGKKNLSVLYHVVHSVIATEVMDQVDPGWLNSQTSPFQGLDKNAFFERFAGACAEYIPAVANARLIGFLEGPRMVLANHDKDDARPSMILENRGSQYLTIFSGKVDHSLRVAENVAAILRQELGHNADSGTPRSGASPHRTRTAGQGA